MRKLGIEAAISPTERKICPEHEQCFLLLPVIAYQLIQRFWLIEGNYGLTFRVCGV